MKKRIVIAFGGNAIDSGSGSPTALNQKKSCEIAAQNLLELINEGHEIMISHGNGPQVGQQLLQNEACDSPKLPAMPLDSLVANTEGMIGYWIQNAFYNLFLKNKIQKNIFTIVTQVLVEKSDPAFSNPTKFIGPFYSESEAQDLAQKKGYIVKEDSGRGWRRVVPSPKPSDIIEKDVISQNMKMGNVVIAVGGGGVPVIMENGALIGVEAVIDKDHASRKLAQLIDADILLILTGVDTVAINFGKTNQEELTKVSVADMKKHIQDKQFPAGSMLPKVESAIHFVESKPGRMAIITSLEKAKNALKDGVGTKITL